MNKVITITTIILALNQPTWGQTLSIRLKSDVKKGDTVIGIIEAAGDVDIESDISQSSFLAKGSGKREVDLGNGKVADVGFHRVKVISGNKNAAILIPVISETAPIAVPTSSPLSYPSGEAP